MGNEMDPNFLRPAEWLKPIKFSPLRVSPETSEALRSIERAAAQLPAWMNRAISGYKLFDDKFIEGLRELGSRIRKDFKIPVVSWDEEVVVLGRAGWYISPEMPITWPKTLATMLSEGKVSEVDSALVEHIESNLASIESEIKNFAPRRSKLIESAFRAHANGMFDLSIPLVLTQVDGLCYDNVQRLFFKSAKGRPETAGAIDISVQTEMAKSWLGGLLWPLQEKSAINLSSRERPEGFDGLNRHMVLHGEVVDYGTKLNGCKAISLLSYVAFALGHIEKDSASDDKAD